MIETVKDLAALGPALGSVVVIGIICWKLIIMFDRQSRVIGGIHEVMYGHAKTIEELNSNVLANTKVTESLAENNKMILNLLISKKI